MTKGKARRHTLKLEPRYSDDESYEIDTRYTRDRATMNHFGSVTRIGEKRNEGVLSVDIYSLIGERGQLDFHDSCPLIIRLHETRNGNHCDEYYFTRDGTLLSHRYRVLDGRTTKSSVVDRNTGRYVSLLPAIRKMIAKHQRKRLMNPLLISFFQSNPVLMKLKPEEESSKDSYGF